MRITNARYIFAVLSVTASIMAAMFAGAVVQETTAARADTPVAHSVSDECGSGYYENSYGACIPGPDSSPGGIRCKDGTNSHAVTRQGACSRHGGIAGGTGGGDSADAALGSAALGALGLVTLLFGSSALGVGLLGSS